MGIVKKLSLCMDKKWVSPIFKGGLNLKNYKKFFEFFMIFLFFINIFIPLFYGTYNDLILQKYTIAKPSILNVKSMQNYDSLIIQNSIVCVT